MFNLDVRSVVFANFAYTAVIGAFMLFFGYRSARRLAGLSWWASGFLFFTTGFLVMSLRNDIPLWISDILPHLFMVLGLLAIKVGLSKFYEVDGRFRLDAVLLAVTILLLVVLQGESLWYRIIPIIGSVFLISLLTILMVRGERDSLTLTAFYGLAMVIQLVRLALAFSIPQGLDPMASGWKFALISMLFFISVTLISLALVSLTVRRLLRIREELIRKEQINSTTDELTGLMNRRGFRTAYESEEKRAARSRRIQSIVIADIDDFKRINDHYGHACGDEVLQYVASVFRREFRGGDILVRWGGEEFLIVQPETEFESCRVSLERTRQAIARDAFRHEDEIFHVTMSFGFHTAPAGEDTFEEQLRKADDNMYRAKRAGKNRVVGSQSGRTSSS